MTEQHQSSDHGKERQRCDPGRMTDLSKPAEPFDGTNRQRQEPVTLMLKDFRVTAEKGLNETEGADRPRIMIAPDKEKNPDVSKAPGNRNLVQAQNDIANT